MDTTKDIYTHLSDKDAAMEYAITYVRDILKKDLRSIVWLKENEDGNHVYEASYTTVLQTHIPSKKVSKK